MESSIAVFLMRQFACEQLPIARCPRWKTFVLHLMCVLLALIDERGMGGARGGGEGGNPAYGSRDCCEIRGCPSPNPGRRRLLVKLVPDCVYVFLGARKGGRDVLVAGGTRRLSCVCICCQRGGRWKREAGRGGKGEVDAKGMLALKKSCPWQPLLIFPSLH